MAKCDIKESSRLRAEFDSDDSKERIKHFSRKGLNLPLSGLVPLAANSCSCSPGPGMLGSQCDALSHPQPPAASEPWLTPLSASARPWVQTRPRGERTPALRTCRTPWSAWLPPHSGSPSRVPEQGLRLSLIILHMSLPSISGEPQARPHHRQLISASLPAWVQHTF